VITKSSERYLVSVQTSKYKEEIFGSMFSMKRKYIGDMEKEMRVDITL